MILSLPIESDREKFHRKTKVDGKHLRFDYRWLPRPEAWYMDVSDIQGDPIIYGQKLVLRYPMFRRTVDERLPDGVFIFVRIDNRDEKLGKNDLGDGVRFLYLTHDEKIDAKPDYVKKVRKI